jgi:cytochrome P450
MFRWVFYCFCVSVVLKVASADICNSETTPTTVSELMFLLTQNGKSYDRLVQEIRQEYPNEKDIKIQSTQGIGFLQACLEEALRLFTPVVISMD